jgi:hypothetical protein
MLRHTQQDGNLRRINYLKFANVSSLAYRHLWYQMKTLFGSFSPMEVAEISNTNKITQKQACLISK